MSNGADAEDLQAFTVELGERIALLREDASSTQETFLALETAHEELLVATQEIRTQAAALEGMTDERGAERRWHERMRQVVPVALFETDLGGLITSANAATAQMLGIASTDLARKPLAAFVARSDRLHIRAMVTDLTAEGVRHAHVTLTPRRRSALPVGLHAAAVGDPADGSPRAIEWVVLPAAATWASRDEGAGVARVFSELARLPLRTSSAHELLRQVASACGEVLAPASGISVSLGPPVAPTEAATDSRLAQLVDGAQMRSGEGPCQDAWDTGETVMCEDLEAETRWPVFRRATAWIGIASIVAAPVKVGGSTVGVLNAYSPAAGAFDADALAVVSVLGETIGALIHHLEAGHELKHLSEQMGKALASRSTIDQAKGILMAAYGGSADDAFDRLSTVSQARNVKLRDVAAEVVDQAQAGRLSQRPDSPS